jgi:hypothetical protein
MFHFMVGKRFLTVIHSDIYHVLDINHTKAEIGMNYIYKCNARTAQ